ncbi:MAG: aldo/keto reductase [Oscillospiraceae bacterium]|nr:aldo/keto reductase [Oscillospiraceae bacterium]
MQYRNDRYGEPISILGYGCMRFTKKGRNIDKDKAEKEIMLAYEKGVNYYDTAYLYPGSEAVLGEILEKNGIRDKVKIATKLPQYLVNSPRAIDKYFDEELSRLRTDHIDYYLMHHITDIVQWENLKKFGIEDWIRRKKESGAIRNIGFSYHGNTENFLKVLNAYDWDFCQIQYNYLDENTQAGRKGLSAAAEKGIPVVIMEPLRGGKLVDLLPAKAKTMIENSGFGYTPAELAFRWLWDQPQVTCVLSGMNSEKMVLENCETASTVKANGFTEKHFKLIDDITRLIISTTKVGCTGCAYCMPCPKGVDIPAIFRCYNRMFSDNKGSGRFEYAQTVALQKEPTFATQCVGCGKCEKHCPQNIKIREELKNADKALRPPLFKAGISLARAAMLKTKKTTKGRKKN